MNSSRTYEVVSLNIAAVPVVVDSEVESDEVAVLFVSPLTASTTAKLQPGPFAPNSTGEIVFKVDSGVLSGHLEAKNLPSLGSHAFYVLWFVRLDTGDKAFLGPAINEKSKSIFLTTAANAELGFRAAEFTDGPAKGTPIALGPGGSNFFVLIAENMIDTFMPFPISEPPSSFALTATF